MPKPKSPPKPKVAAQNSIQARRAVIAQLSGTLCGLPGACQRASDALEDIRQRIERAKASMGILNELQQFTLGGMLGSVRVNIDNMSYLRRASDELAKHEAIPPE